MTDARLRLNLDSENDLFLSAVHEWLCTLPLQQWVHLTNLQAMVRAHTDRAAQVRTAILVAIAACSPETREQIYGAVRQAVVDKNLGDRLIADAFDAIIDAMPEAAFDVFCKSLMRP